MKHDPHTVRAIRIAELDQRLYGTVVAMTENRQTFQVRPDQLTALRLTPSPFAPSEEVLTALVSCTNVPTGARYGHDCDPSSAPHLVKVTLPGGYEDRDTHAALIERTKLATSQPLPTEIVRCEPREGSVLAERRKAQPNLALSEG
ncbi:MAG: hypothetical protein AVDCRST_MAG91-401 [uncultured Sphingomonadaceae bacterium]|uniref:Uncharacterized protein n=1 Tax=uncultured Sphingomonadaceae bacterium TaxID=169976 RepID=A0A6J4S8U4_9SPHN|nr:MAG: hypothetical protein AVDCRST_MAG91-401 [uncultured Sphingomonadaceae bacterium]